MDRKTASDLAEQIKTFGRYGFNRSHSAAYSLISYKTAWLKRHYPSEFMAALLSSVLDKTDDVVKYIGECRELGRHVPELTDGVEVLPPDVNESGWKFTAVGSGKVRFGLGAVKGVGSAAVESIIEARDEGGAFDSLFTFLERIDIRALNKRACEALIAAGALDGFGHRAQMLAGLDAAYGEATARVNDAAVGQQSLFGDDVAENPPPELPSVPEWDDRERLAREKEALGFFISGHPLDRYREVADAFDPLDADARKARRGAMVEVACVVTGVARQINKRTGAEWGKVTVEGFYGTATVLAFKDAWRSCRDTLATDAVVLVRGRVSDSDRDEDDPPLFLDAAEPLRDVQNSGRIAVRIGWNEGEAASAEALERARAVMKERRGGAPVEVVVGEGDGAARLRSRTMRVVPDRQTIRALEEVFGSGRVEVVRG